LSIHRVKRIVVSYASGSYLAGQTRLLQSLDSLSIPYRAHYEQKSGQNGKYTPHAEIPYYFKAEMMAEVANETETILWCDASVFATGIGNLDPLFERIETHGYLLPWSGWTNDKWCNDRSLAAFGFTRDQAAIQRHVMGDVYGFATSHPIGKMLIKEHLHHRDLFGGQHHNVTQSESADPRCLGHRHDQSVLSLLAHFHHLEVYCHPPSWIHY
jgi:hypothetical protein